MSNSSASSTASRPFRRKVYYVDEGSAVDFYLEVGSDYSVVLAELFYELTYVMP